MSVLHFTTCALHCRAVISHAHQPPRPLAAPLGCAPSLRPFATPLRYAPSLRPFATPFAAPLRYALRCAPCCDPCCDPTLYNSSAALPFSRRAHQSPFSSVPAFFCPSLSSETIMPTSIIRQPIAFVNDGISVRPSAFGMTIANIAAKTGSAVNIRDV